TPQRNDSAEEEQQTPTLGRPRTIEICRGGTWRDQQIRQPRQGEEHGPAEPEESCSHASLAPSNSSSPSGSSYTISSSSSSLSSDSPGDSNTSGPGRTVSDGDDG